MPHAEIAIIGAGFSGLGTAARLLAEGRRDFVILERAPRVGGVWRDNVYPNCACDVPAHLYALSFAPNSGWTNTYAGQPEILAYLESLVARFELAPYLRLSHAVREAAWDEHAKLWRLQTSRGELTAKYVVFAGGALTDPNVPNIPGTGSFRGRTFHSARWDAKADTRDKRVGVIGTGASAVQIIPALQQTAQRLDVFQRTPSWVLPRRARAIGPHERTLLERVPFFMRLRRWALYWARENFALAFIHPRLGWLPQKLALNNLRRIVKDPNKRKALTPAYRFGCKRVVVSDDYYQALARDNVRILTESISRIEPRGIVTNDGVLHELDVIVFATGFNVLNVPIFARIVGRGGVALADAWTPSASAHLGTSVNGFPNFFFLQGPNTGLGHTSVIIMIEAQIDHMLKAMAHVDAHHAAAIEPTARAQRQFVDDVQAGLAGSVWNTGGCRSWYLDANGYNATLWPDTTRAYTLKMRAFDPQDYTMERL